MSNIVIDVKAKPNMSGQECVQLAQSHQTFGQIIGETFRKHPEMLTAAIQECCTLTKVLASLGTFGTIAVAGFYFNSIHVYFNDIEDAFSFLVKLGPALPAHCTTQVTPKGPLVSHQEVLSSFETFVSYLKSNSTPPKCGIAYLDEMFAIVTNNIHEGGHGESMNDDTLFFCCRIFLHIDI